MPGETPENGRSKSGERGKAVEAMNLGLNFAVAVGLLSYLGHQIDEHRGGGRGWTLAGVFLGLLYGAYEVWKLTRGTAAREDS